MTYNHSPAPKNKKEYIQSIATGLVKKHGKKKFYAPIEVIQINEEIYQEEAINFYWWGMCIFCSYDDFLKNYEEEDNKEQKTSDTIYDDMRAKMLVEFTIDSIENWQYIPTIDHDVSWLDFGDLAETVFEGLTEFLAGIFEAISS